MSTFLSMLAAVALMLCGLTLTVSGKDVHITPTDNALGKPLKTVTVRDGSDDFDVHRDGHTLKKNSEPIEGTDLEVSDDNADGTGRMLDLMSSKISMPTELSKATTDRQWFRKCGPTIPYSRPVACERNLKVFWERTWRRDSIRVSTVVVYGGIGILVRLTRGGPIRTTVALAVGVTPLGFSKATSVKGADALFVYDINRLNAPRFGSCCWKRINFIVRIRSCLFGNCGTEDFKYFFVLRCPKVCWGRGRPLPMNANRRCPSCRRW